MTRKLILGLLLAAASIIVTTAILALLPGMANGKELLTEPVDTSQTLVLHFENYQIKVIPWDRDEVKVKLSPVYKDADISIHFNENTFSVESADLDKFDPGHSVTFQSQTWIILMLFDKYFDYAQEVWDQRYVDFYIYIPRNINIDVYSSGIIGAANGVGFRNINFIPDEG